MSSGFQYLPKPPRVWSRVQNRCSTNTDNSSLVYVPLSNEYMPQADANYKTQMYVKGNVLQYKKNSSSLTKQQKYSLISKGMWVGKKSYATQSETYTNPNTTSLLRVNYSNIPFPNVIVGYPNNISGPFQYNVANPFDCSTNLLQDGGNLVCNAVVSPCTGEVTQTFTEQQCFPTTCSNVPGPIKDLCWNPKIQTWYPKNRTTMNNSGTKWPVNYKGLVSAVKPEPPTLLTIYGGCGTISLTWSYIESACIPVSNFYIFANDVLVEILSYEYTSTTLTGLSFNTTYSVYIKSVSNTTLSEKSNTLTTTTLPLPSAPSNLTGSAGCAYVSLSWDAGTGVCLYYYNIYLNGSLYESISSSLTSTTIYNLNYNTTYSIYVKSGSSASGSGESGESNVISLTTSALNTPTLTISSYNQSPAGVTFDLSTGSSGCTTSSYSYNLYYSTNGTTYAFVSISGTGSLPQSYTYTPLSYNNIYYFYIKYVASNGDLSAASSPIINVDTTAYPVTFLIATATSSTSVNLSWNLPTSTIFCTGYDVSYNTGTQTISSSSTTNATISSLTSGTTYTFYVYANYNGTLSTDVSINLTMPYGYTISASGFNTTLSTYNTSSTITDAHDTSGVLVFTDTSSSADMSLNFTFYDGSLNYLIVSGGGGGGGGGGGYWTENNQNFGGLGGGGGGGSSETNQLSNGDYAVTVGSGGSSGSGGNSSGTNGSSGGSGGSSSLGSISQTGGSGGGGGGAHPNNDDGTQGSSGTYGPTANNGGDGGRGDGSNSPAGSTAPGKNGNGTYSPFSFTVGSTYNIYAGGGGGGGLIADTSETNNLGGVPNSNNNNGGLGGWSYDYDIGQTGTNGNTSLSNINSIYVGGGGGGGGSDTDSYDIYCAPGLQGGSGAQGIVIVWWGATS